MWLFRCVAILIFFSALGALGQVNTGELRLKITDTAGLGVKTSAQLISEANQYSNTVTTNDAGYAQLARLPYGVYLIRTSATGFAPAEKRIQIASAIPVDAVIKLEVAGVTTVVKVTDTGTLIDPDQPSSIMRIGTQQIEDRVGSLPGRSLQDLVNTQPGWLYEGNAVLHPRGSEYQTQFVIDGIPLTDNRSPSFGPELEADDLDSMSIYTAGFPAEYGRRMGGVVELNTSTEVNPGLHGKLVLAGGSYDTANGYGQIQQKWGSNLFGVTAAGSMTSHYLNPVVPENFTNNGTTGDFSTRYERDFTPTDRLWMSVRHAFSRFQIPNELVQQQAGQRQYGDNFETMGIIGYQHIFSSDVLGNFSGMVRNNANNLYSNENSTPIIAFQNNDFNEGYFKGTVSIHRNNQEWKAGAESDNIFLNENLSYQISDPSYFDPGTPLTGSFLASRPELDQSAFVEDLLRLDNWTISAGLRWDHYQLLLNQNAVSPRISIGRYFPSANTVVHASYDRIFQTPEFENILISSSPDITSLNPSVLRLPVQPSHGNYYEGGLSKAFADSLRLDINIYRRDMNNFADDDQLLNTGVSYPIAFDHAVIYGAEGKLDLVHWRKLSGYVSYSYMVGNAWFPVTGGLFLGDDASNAISQLSGHFPVSQDQRNTVRSRFFYQFTPRFWMAAGLQYGSGLPFAFTGTYDQALAEYGPAVVDRVNFDRGRVDPNLSVSASAGADIYKSDRLTMRFQADGENLTNRLNVIDFGGLFSGNALGPARSFSLRLTSNF